MRRRCLSADELAGFVRRRGTENDERHVRGCERCTRRVTLVRRIAEGGLGPIADTAAEVEGLVSRLNAAPRDTWWKLVREPEYRRADVARRLLSVAIDERLRDTHVAVELGKAAAAIVDAVTDVDACNLRFEVWKFLSAVLREAGRYSEAERALARGEDAARLAVDPEVAAASMCLSRALVYAEPDVWRPEEAAALLDRAESVFVKRDAARMHAVRTARAFLLFRSGAMRSARDAFLDLLETTPQVDRENYLNALSNLTWVRVELREADSDVEQAIALLIDENEALGRRVQVARAEWMMGRVDLFRGEYAAAAELLTRAMTTIADSDASVRAGLDAAEALLLANRHDEAFALARELASTAVALDQREPSRRHRLTLQVFAYLREAAQRQALTADLVTHAARYLDRMMRQSPFEFIPPMPLTDM